MKVRTILGLGIVSLGLFFSPVQAQDLPPDVEAFERIKHLIPPMTSQGKPYGGLRIEAILAKAETLPPGMPFFVGHAFLAKGEQPPIPDDVVLAFGLYCELGVRDAGPDGPHFSKSLNPLCRVERYGKKRVVLCNHGGKALESATPAGIQAAADFFSRPLPAQLDMRPPLDQHPDTMPLLADAQCGGLPLRKGGVGAELCPQTAPAEPRLLIISGTRQLVPFPTTDAEAQQVLDYEDQRLTAILRGLYSAYRGLGSSIPEALEKTWNAYLRQTQP